MRHLLSAPTRQAGRRDVGEREREFSITSAFRQATEGVSYSGGFTAIFDNRAGYRVLASPGRFLHDAETKVRRQWAELKVKLILGFVNSLSAVPGTLNRPTLPISPLKQGGIVVSTGAQTYGAWKMALGHDITEADALLMGLGD